MESSNSYEDAKRAEAYARLEFSGTYYLAYRDLPGIILSYVTGRKALDFGCGTGRSTRFLRKLGFDVTGADIAEEMVGRARALDPEGDYRLIADGDLSAFPDDAFHLTLSAFTFDNVPTLEKKVAYFQGLRRVLKVGGILVNLVSTPDIYLHEWASFSTKDFPENRSARSGDRVRIVITDIEDSRPVEDIVWSDADYHDVYAKAELEWIQTHKPLAREDEPYRWVNETRIAPWAIYVVRRPGSMNKSMAA